MASPADSATSDDRLLDGRLLLRQPRRGYRVAIDPVVLAAAVPAGAGDRVLDVGCGVGAAALCLAWRVTGCRVVGVERDPELAALARHNAKANGLVDRVAIHTADLAALPDELKNTAFDLVMTNPPYHPPEAGTASEARAGATRESLPLVRWLELCLRRLKPRGWLVVVHRAGRLAELCCVLREGCGDVRILPLWPSGEARAAQRVLVAARKGGRGESRLLRGLVLHGRDGRFTPEAEAVLRRGEPLVLVERRR